MDFFQNIFDMTGFASLLTNPGYILMILIGCILLFLGISKKIRTTSISSNWFWNNYC